MNRKKFLYKKILVPVIDLFIFRVLLIENKEEKKQQQLNFSSENRVSNDVDQVFTLAFSHHRREQYLIINNNLIKKNKYKKQ